MASSHSARQAAVRQGQVDLRRKPLTARQRRVVYLIGEGCTNAQIGRLMAVSEAAAKKHLEALQRRYGVTGRAAIFRAAAEVGDIRLRLRLKLKK